jgi:TonB family protein
MLIYQRRDLDIPDILAASEAVTVRATLDKTGKLKSLDVADYSGSSAMDRTLIEALRQAAFDPNPPSGAANEQGEFEFLFQAQIVASLGPGGGPSQVRGIESRLRVGLL